MDNPTCIVDDCTDPVKVKSRGWCSTHYQRWQKYGTTDLPEKAPVPETCILGDCQEPVAVPKRGWCKAHYRRWQFTGDPLSPDLRTTRRSPEARFWEKVDKNGAVPASDPGLGPCWLWKDRVSNGYGTFWVDDTFQPVHRWSYAHFVKSIPEGYEIDHICHPGDGSCPPAMCLHRRCVNPAHLTPATRRENTLRSASISAINLAKTHCPKGHPYDEENTHWYTNPDGVVGRLCKQCWRKTPEERLPNKNASKTVCVNGHPYDEENTFYIKDGGGRRCKICMRATWTRRNAKVRAQRIAQNAGALF